MIAANEDLERRLFQLETLYEIGRECARVRTVPDVLRVMLFMLMGSFSVVRGIAFAGDAAGRVDVVARGLAGDDRLAADALARSYLLAGGGDGWLRAAGLEVCLPFRLDHSTRGVIALGPKLGGEPYTDEDRALLEIIVANACPYLQNVKLFQALQVAADELARKVRALAVVNEITLGITARPSVRRLHRFLVERFASALDAAEGALGLQGDGGWTVAARYLDDGAHGEAPEAEVLARLAACGPLSPGPSRAVPLTSDLSPTRGEGPGARSIAPRDEGKRGSGDQGALELLAPVRYGRDLLGAVWLRRDRQGRPFDADDRTLLELLANEAAVILENSRLFERFLVQQQEQFRLRGMLEQYMAPAVAERLISGETRPALEGARLPVSVLMVDMRGSTELINRVEPEVMVRLLNQYLGRITDILFRYEGTIDKFEGDAVLGFFGAPESHADDPLRAVRAAADMQRAFAALRDEWQQRHALPARLGIGVGIATGEVVVGNIGSGKRLEHTVIGSVVNLAARLTAKAAASTIQVDGATWDVVAGPLGFTTRSRARRPRYVRAKGFATLVPVYRLRAPDVPATV